MVGPGGRRDVGRGKFLKEIALEKKNYFVETRFHGKIMPLLPLLRFYFIKKD